jgi:hypothetical protein
LLFFLFLIILFYLIFLSNFDPHSLIAIFFYHFLNLF